MTTIYLIRHSEPLKVNNVFNTDSLQVQNEKQSLSINGESIAKEKLNNKEFDNIDILYSSNYVRAIQTSKYLSAKNNLEINVVSNLGERRFGINSWNEFPENFERKQFLDENYKIGNGESQKEVRDRMYSTIMKIVTENRNRRIAIVSHSTAITYLLKEWCDIKLENDKISYYFNNNLLLKGNFDYCETFKLVFDDENKIISIKNIKG